MATIRGPQLGNLDPAVLALRTGYVAYHDRLLQQWPSVESGRDWAAERALWTEGETMVCTTEEIFVAASGAGLDWKPFTHQHDPDQDRLWQVPGREGGPLVEVAVIDGAYVVIGRPDDPNAVRQTRSEIARKGGNTRWRNSHGS